MDFIDRLRALSGSARQRVPLFSRIALHLALGVSLNACITDVPPEAVDADSPALDMTVAASMRHPDPDTFAIQLYFASDVSDTAKAAALVSASRWNEILADMVLPDVAMEAGEQICPGGEWGTLDEDYVVDDLLILVSQDSIDGPGKTLARARACVRRGHMDNWMPVVGEIVLDVDDPISIRDVRAEREALNLMNHEIGHVLGIDGGMWDWLGLLRNPSDTITTRDTYFEGRRARFFFDYSGGDDHDIKKVPVHSDNTHWRGDLVGNELMSPWMHDTLMPLSLVTLGALHDIGWRVDYSMADSFKVTPPDSTAAHDQDDAPRVMFDRPMPPRPMVIVREDGLLYEVSKTDGSELTRVRPGPEHAGRPGRVWPPPR